MTFYGDCMKMCEDLTPDIDLFIELLAHFTEEDIAPKNGSSKTVEHIIQYRQLCQSYICCSKIKSFQMLQAGRPWF
jgi:hypothetical protein